MLDIVTETREYDVPQQVFDLFMQGRLRREYIEGNYRAREECPTSHVYDALAYYNQMYHLPRRATASPQQIQTIADMVSQRVLDLYDPHTYGEGDDLADEE